MNRQEAVTEILRLKDAGVKNINIIIDGQSYAVPTKYNDLVGTIPLSSKFAEGIFTIESNND